MPADLRWLFDVEIEVTVASDARHFRWPVQVMAIAAHLRLARRQMRRSVRVGRSLAGQRREAGLIAMAGDAHGVLGLERRLLRMAGRTGQALVEVAIDQQALVLRPRHRPGPREKAGARHAKRDPLHSRLVPLHGPPPSARLLAAGFGQMRRAFIELRQPADVVGSAGSLTMRIACATDFACSEAVDLDQGAGPRGP